MDVGNHREQEAHAVIIKEKPFFARRKDRASVHGVFGMSFGEFVIVLVIGIVVVGPRKLPSLLRSAGQLIGQLRRMAVDVRKESGIDQLLEAEGINKEIDTFRRLAAGDVSPDDGREGHAAPAAEGQPDAITDAYAPKANQPDPYAPTGEAAPPPQVPPPPLTPSMPPPLPPAPPKISRPLPGLPHPIEGVKPK
jgi:Tat protein translocase TatB subunit